MPPSPLAFTFIGSSNAFTTPRRWWNGFIVNERYLFDIPPSVVGQLTRSGSDINAIDTIFLSHRHADHFLGLPFLILDWTHRHKRTTDVTVVCPPDTEEKLNQVMDLVFPGTLQRARDYAIRWRHVRPGDEGEANGARFRVYEMEHTTSVGLCLGYQVEVGGRVFAYTGDTRLCSSVRAMAQGAEVLVAECASAHDRNPLHMNLEDIREVRASIDPRTAMILTHLDDTVTVDGLPNTLLANDFDSFRFDHPLLEG